MDFVAKAVQELSLAVNNFSVGAVTFSDNKYSDGFQHIDESFKIRKSQSLLGRAYKEQHYSTLNNGEEILSSLSMQSARILEREKIITECQQIALQGMVEILAIERVLQNHLCRNEGPEKYLEIKSKITALENELIVENSVDTEICDENGYEDILLKEKILIKETQQYLKAITTLKEKRDSMLMSNPSTSKLLQMVRHKLEQINFMRMLIVNLVGAMDVDLTKRKDIADLVFKRCKPLLYHDLSL